MIPDNLPWFGNWGWNDPEPLPEKKRAKWDNAGRRAKPDSIRKAKANRARADRKRKKKAQKKRK